jgi:pimeloyl-ACP methyl ester carboxylesterase
MAAGRLLGLLLLLVVSAGASAAVGAGSIGVVLLHGKADTPLQFSKLGAALTGAGYRVAAPEMCWSKARIFDQALPDCFKEVDAAVADLKQKGVKSVVVGGEGEGAIAAIDYGVTHAGLAGVIAIGPVADPPDAKKYPDFAAAIKAAQLAVKTKKGAAIANFSDLLDGAPLDVTASAAAFLSFHGPDSPVSTIRGVKGKVLPKLSVPLLWISGTHDPTQASTRAVFGAAPDNKLSTYLRIEADHAGTPDAAADSITAWLRTLG